jgi:type II secretory pathway component GspD/PulD (secretin)
MPITKSKLIVKVPETQKTMSLKHLQHACLGLFSLILTAMPAVTVAQETVESEAQNLPASAQDKLTLNFQDADIHALINAVSKITGKNFIVDPRVKGRSH